MLFVVCCGVSWCIVCGVLLFVACCVLWVVDSLLCCAAACCYMRVIDALVTDGLCRGVVARLCCAVCVVVRCRCRFVMVSFVVFPWAWSVIVSWGVCCLWLLVVWSCLMFVVVVCNMLLFVAACCCFFVVGGFLVDVCGPVFVCCCRWLLIVVIGCGLMYVLLL